MTMTILITGSSDGIGLETAKALAAQNHDLLLHGRSETGNIETYRADLSSLEDVNAFAQAVANRHDSLDVVINNAGIFRTADPVTESGHDVRFVVNTIAPYLLTRQLLPLLGQGGRIINLSSAAQAPVDAAAFSGARHLDHGEAYAQSKLALTMWSKDLGIGVDILTRAATSSEFDDATGRYYDNDAGRFSSPHPDALDPQKNQAIVELIEATIASIAE